MLICIWLECSQNALVVKYSSNGYFMHFYTDLLFIISVWLVLFNQEEYSLMERKLDSG